MSVQNLDSRYIFCLHTAQCTLHTAQCTTNEDNTNTNLTTAQCTLNFTKLHLKASASVSSPSSQCSEVIRQQGGSGGAGRSWRELSTGGRECRDQPLHNHQHHLLSRTGGKPSKLSRGQQSSNPTQLHEHQDCEASWPSYPTETAGLQNHWPQNCQSYTGQLQTDHLRSN